MIKERSLNDELAELRKRILTIYLKPRDEQEFYCLWREGKLHVFDSRDLFENYAFGTLVPSAASLPSERDAGLKTLIDTLETLNDCMSRAPWAASPRWPKTQPFQVKIGSYEYECPAGSGQVRADNADIPSGCLIPFGIIHQDDAEGIAELRNLIPELINAIRARVTSPDGKEK